MLNRISWTIIVMWFLLELFAVGGCTKVVSYVIADTNTVYSPVLQGQVAVRINAQKVDLDTLRGILSELIYEMQIQELLRATGNLAIAFYFPGQPVWEEINGHFKEYACAGIISSPSNSPTLPTTEDQVDEFEVDGLNALVHCKKSFASSSSTLPMWSGYVLVAVCLVILLSVPLLLKVWRGRNAASHQALANGGPERLKPRVTTLSTAAIDEPIRFEHAPEQLASRYIELQADPNKLQGSDKESTELPNVLGLNLEDVRAKEEQTANVQRIIDSFTSKANSSGPRDPTQSMDHLHQTLYSQIITQRRWSKQQFVELCKGVNLLPEGAMDKINKAFLDSLGEVLLDGDDPIVINEKFVKELEP